MEQETRRRVEGSHSQEARKLSQETKAILAAATSIIVLLLGLLVTNLHTSSRIEARIDRAIARTEARIDQLSASTEARLDQMQAEARNDRAAWQAEASAMRAEAKAEASAMRAEAKADRQDFQRQILRLTEEQVRTAAVVEQMRTTSR